VTRTFSVKGT